MATGSVYLLHFERPYQHAQHYVGFTFNLDQRMADHRSGRGARLIEVITRAGISFTVARVWKHTTRQFERQIKKNGHTRRHCPVCQAAASNLVVPDDEGQAVIDAGVLVDNVPLGVNPLICCMKAGR